MHTVLVTHNQSLKVLYGPETQFDIFSLFIPLHFKIGPKEISEKIAFQDSNSKKTLSSG